LKFFHSSCKIQKIFCFISKRNSLSEYFHSGSGASNRMDRLGREVVAAKNGGEIKWIGGVLE
jgi:hypothetical protein